jgi:hypothetical protein
MARVLYTPSTTPVSPSPSPLLLFIQQAQLALVTRSELKHPKTIETLPTAEVFRPAA